MPHPVDDAKLGRVRELMGPERLCRIPEDFRP